ncbi:Sec-independent protein translocase protein TatB [Asaia lannensis]|uniref:Sec-independent protein translocase protein TatB n=1 Tax=Asaia lannensis TaxID=415421 RepID=UPI002156B665|nr:Sec-independent protein translocase protein TatB [Asaia lannensis]GBQ97909.1 Sec-independent protein translocase TatB [Asaia lannensis NBRC 102526]
MFDFSWSEIALIVVVALVFIGPKDMPTAIRAVSRGIKAVRRMASEFQGHVDDMIREADLGEARDHLRDLKRFDFRDRIARTIDSDQTISKSLDFTPPPSLSSPAHAAPSAIPVSGPGVATTEPQTSVEKPDEPGGPSILPPSTARRLRHEETLWHAPAIIPPMRVIHSGRRVSLDPPAVDAPQTVPPVAQRSASHSAAQPVTEASSDPDSTAPIHAHGAIQPECPTAP